MTVIKLPKTPKSAFNPDRPAGALLMSQLAHLEHAVGLPERTHPRTTEGEAARRIGELTAALFEQQRQQQVPGAPPAPPQRPKRKKKSAARPAKARRTPTKKTRKTTRPTKRRRTR
jgi:hypothetical protein